MSRKLTSLVGWAMVAAAVLTIWIVWRAWPRVEPRRDAGSPARPFTPQQLGPRPEEVIRAMTRKGFPSPPDAAE